MLVQDGRTGFIGFGGLSETMGNAFGYVPKIAGAEDEGDQHDIDSELRMLMRKMGKKDKTTRLKVHGICLLHDNQIQDGYFVVRKLVDRDTL